MRLNVSSVLITLVAGISLLSAACGSSSSPVTPTPTATITAVSPAASATPEPTAMASAVVPTISPTPIREVASRISETLPTAAEAEVRRVGDIAFEFLTSFTEAHSPRPTGTQQERAAAEFLAGVFRDIGFQTEFQDFTFETVSTSVELAAEGDEVPAVQAIRMTLSVEGAATGALVHVERAFAEDIPLDGLEAKIALIKRGVISFEEKISRVSEVGAVGAIVYNNASGLFGGTLQNRSRIPVVTTSLEMGEAILELLERRDVEATVSVANDLVESRNVIAEIPGTDGRVVVLGGHYDTVPGVPGANDNGSGIASLIAAAEEIAGSDYPFTVRIIAFGAEELGLHGSEHYVNSLSEEERAAIVAMLNYDALAGSDVLGVTGDSDLQDTAVELARDIGIELRRRLLPRNASSDHASFLNANIPAVFFMDNDFSRIHTPYDRLDFIRPELMGQSVVIGLALLDSLARP
ncbi:MAG: M28 family metallopeptidase [Chloroflexi bacterium]|nr:M28 family metallopeptidase [Chloroflexota bacterium]